MTASLHVQRCQARQASIPPGMVARKTPKTSWLTDGPTRRSMGTTIWCHKLKKDLHLKQLVSDRLLNLGKLSKQASNRGSGAGGTALVDKEQKRPHPSPTRVFPYWIPVVRYTCATTVRSALGVHTMIIGTAKKRMNKTGSERYRTCNLHPTQIFRFPTC
ncbi:hypothetical protein PAAG_02137 [Paracoccidioides lutzii Pb01]|uniref:Uncharacterized protein n=1 Tax=Paracoccidioides lutzii (strain ATCC MYA-826 / Pb01) TaxID=502779 RepID=C1GUE2_PARBA|nr:hypothetical protein PAAG_02137 [Paracoccidioides lutzii Pb01]EEH39948.2 hypothetical protein PAAG_02137 [Paracoccidioides lutzii Pb01]